MQPLEALGGVIGRLVWLGLLHSLWLGLAAAASVALVLRVRPSLSHRLRHATLLASLVVVALGPPAVTALQHLAAAPGSLSAPMRGDSALIVLREQGRTAGASAPGSPPPRRPANASAASRLARSLRVPLARAAGIVRAVQPVGLVAWSVAVACLGAALAVAVSGVDRLRRKASPAPSDVRSRALALGRRLRLRDVPEVSVHPGLRGPCLCGVLRPVILLPGRWLADASAEMLDAVLAHELAHARRLDNLVNLAQRLVEVLLFFHPGVHWLSRSLRRQRELCADALAVRLTGDPLALASALESVARLRFTSPAPRPVGVALGGEDLSLLPRIQELIGMTPPRPRPSLWPFAALPAAAACALVAASVGLAQDRPAPSPEAPAEAERADSVTPPTASAGPARDRSPTPLLGPAPSPREPEERMISYQVRVLHLEPDSWQPVLEGRAGPAPRGGVAAGWIVDDAALKELLAEVQRQKASSVLVAPKVSSYEHARATISMGGPERGVASPREKGQSPRTADERDAAEGWRVELAGSLLPRATRLSIDLRYASPDDSGPGTIPSEVRYRATWDVPEGSSLVVGLGQHRGRAAGRPVTTERLAVLTPRRILTEAEECAILPAPGRASSKPASR